MSSAIRHSSVVAINMLIIIIVCSFSAYSQQEKLLYEIARQKDKEVSTTPKFMHIARVSFYPDSLPPWFFNPPMSGGDEFYAIGISDPDMPTDSAMMQAVERAKGMIAFQIDSKVQYFRDIYNIERISGKYTELGQKYDTYYKISSTVPFCTPSFAVVDSHFTRYNEQMVLVKYSLPVKAKEFDKVEAQASVVKLEFTLNDVFELQEEYDVHFSQACKNDSDNIEAGYIYRLRDWRFSYTSTTKSKVHNYPSYSYKYYGPNEYDSTIVFTSYPGLWAGLVRGWMLEMTEHAEQGRKFVRSIGDKYQPKSENIVRETSRIRGSFGFQGLRLRDDKIDVNLFFLDAFEKNGKTSTINNNNKRPES